MVKTAESAVLEKLLEPLGVCLTPEVARKIIRLRADPQSQARIEELARKSRNGTLSPSERAEYQTYVSAGTFIAILQSKARALLSAKPRR
jgi:hypothetical protein